MIEEAKWSHSLVIATAATFMAFLYFVIILPIIRMFLRCEDRTGNLCATSIGLLVFVFALAFIGIAYKEHDLSRMGARLFFVVILVLLVIMFILGPSKPCW